VTQITINSITGLNPPYSIYACDGYGLNCVLISAVTVTITTPLTITLPSPQFDSAPGVGIRVITSNGCERFEVVICTETPTPPLCDYKQFQDDVCFEFMDGDPYYFQN